MYKVESDYYEKLIRSNYRRLGWAGTIVDKQGRSYPFRSRHIASGSGTITRSCAGSTDLELGSVYASEFDVGVYSEDLGITDRYVLYDGKIDINALIYISNGIDTWNDAAACTWEELSSSSWKAPDAYDKVPLGEYTIQEATRSAGIISIKAYDNMIKFEKSFRQNGSTKPPYKWLTDWCDKCGVELGMTRAEVEKLTNGSAQLSLTLVDDLETYRDALSHLAAALCSVAQIDRAGRLVLKPFGKPTVQQTIKASQRFSSSLADYITRFTGLYATHSAGGMTEYYKVTPDDGLIYNVGTNAFLQEADDSVRKRLCQNIINTLSLVRYTPFEAEIPCDPCLDPMDIIDFSGGHAAGEVSCITEVILKLNGSMSIKCVGENPMLNQAKSRYSKDISGLLATEEGVEGTSTFWLADAYLNDDLVIDTAAQVVAACEFKISTDKGRGDINFTTTYYMVDEGVVTVVVYVDDIEWYFLQDYKKNGHCITTVTTPFEVASLNDETHEVRIEIACLPNEAPVSDLTWQTSGLYTWGEMTSHTWGGA